MKITLKTRIYGASLFAALLILVAGFAALPRLLLPLCASPLETELSYQADAASHRLAAKWRASDSLIENARILSTVAPATGDRVALFAPDGSQLSPPQLDKAVYSDALKKGMARSSMTNDDLRVSSPVRQGVKIVAVLVLSTPLRSAKESAQKITAIALATAIVAILLALPLNLQAANAFSRLIRWIASILQKTPEGDLPQRIRTRSGDDVGDLIRALNATFKGAQQKIAQLKEAETTLRAALAHMADGMAAFDAEGRILIFNHAAEDLFGRTAMQANGRTLLEVTLHRELDTLVNEALKSGVQGEAEIVIRRPVFRILRAFVTPVPGENAPLLGATLVLQDLTEIRRLEDMRRDFVTNASHELKTPLATIGVMVDTLKAGMSEDPEMADRFLGTIGSEVRRLGALVDDLLDLSRIESGNVSIEREALSLRSILRKVVQTFQPEAESRNQTLTQDSSSDAVIWADPNAIIRIASNLVENALKYTSENGRITVSCGESEDRAFLRVEDTGIGISDAAKSRIFERFYRADKARSRATGGTGLGLSIVKHLAEAHDGYVQVESEPGRGSVFTVWLPALSEEDWTDA